MGVGVSLLYRVRSLLCYAFVIATFAFAFTFGGCRILGPKGFVLSQEGDEKTPCVLVLWPEA